MTEGSIKQRSDDRGPARRWRLRTDSPDVVAVPFELDEYQQRLVSLIATPGHGPVLLLAGPGTGKTTTLVEAVAARVASGTDPARILTLTFSRKAANELRVRIGRRLDRTVSAPLAWTFHGFGFSLLGQSQAEDEQGRSLRLMSGPEQDVAVRDLLIHDREVGTVQWPPALHAALPTRGFTDEVRALIGRARSLGLGPADLHRVAAGRDDWTAAAEFMAEYLDVLDGRGVVDYAELVARAVAYAESERGRERLRATYDLVLVDEYQDTDPAQERLLQAIAGSGRDLVVVGDPDQSIYAFRGADVRGILSFPDRFRGTSGEPAQTMVLQTSRRCATEILSASRRIASQLGGTGTDFVRHLREHRALQPAPDQHSGSVEVYTFASAESEAASIADLLRREHLHDGTPWSDMAVVVRSGVMAIPSLQRAMAHAGVPVEVAGDEVPLAREPVLGPLLTALQVVSDPSTLTPDVARELMLSALGGADPGGLRRLGRALREQERAAGRHAGGPPSSGELLRAALADGTRLETTRDAVAAPIRRLASLLSDARAMANSGGTAHDILWLLWSGTHWPTRLQQASFAGGPAGRAADRDLDAIVALFEVAARGDDRSTSRGVASFLAEVQAQQIPGDTLAERSTRPSGVRLLTAHRSKGLEWSVVVVAGVQAEVWPDLRRRGSLLQADRLGSDGLLPGSSGAEQRRDEHRLFYVAITRAKRRVVVTAVDSPAEDGLRPSSFIAELGVAVAAVAAAPVRALTLRDLTAELRAVVVDESSPEMLRTAAAERLAVLATAQVAGRPMIPAAHPEHWWGMNQLTHADRPVRPAEAPLELSGSQLQKLAACPLNWFLSREVRADPARGTAAGFGGVVHALADGVARGEILDDPDELLRRADTVWEQLQYGAAWESAAERNQAAAALERFVAWHRAARGRTLAGSEQQFEALISVSGRKVRLRGRLDRVEFDDAGRVVVVDLKTGRQAPSQRQVSDHLQLATYQRVVAESAITDVVGEPGGAELVHLRLPPRANQSGPKVQQQPAFPAGREVLDEALEDAVQTIDNEEFSARLSDACKYCPFTRSCPAQDSGRQVVS